MKNNNVNKDNNKDNKRKKRIIIYIIIIIILFLLTLFGCKKCQDINNNKLINSLPKLNNEGYWVDKDNNKLTDKQSNYKNVNSFDYYKKIENNYNKSIYEFAKEFNSNNLEHKFKVEFYKNNEDIYDVKEYNYLDKLIFPNNPTQEGSFFKGWKLLNYKNESNIVFTKDNTLLVDDNFKFYPIFVSGETPLKDNFKVEFLVDDKTYKEFEVKKGNKIDKFDNPNKEDNMFLGWYDEFDNKFDFDKNIINRDYILKAKFYKLNPNLHNLTHTINVYDHNNNLISTDVYKHYEEVVLKRFTDDYVYEYYQNREDIYEKIDEIKDDTYFRFNIEKDINLVAKGHKKHIKFITNDDEIKIIDSFNNPLENDIIEVSTGSPITLAKVKKDNHYRLNKVVWQIDNNGVKEDFNDSIYNYNYDLTLYYKEDPSMYDNILNIEEHEDHINIVGLNEPYASTPNYTLTIPEIINDKKVVSISNLGTNNNLEKVVLPKTIERIEKDCFHWNTNLKEINLEDTNLKYIGENAFSACESLEKIKLPTTCNVVDEAAFQHCKNLKEVDLSLTHMRHISAYAFRYCISLEDLKLPSDLKYIYQYAFWNCHKLNNVDLKNTKVIHIGDYAFSSCYSLNNITFYEDLYYIGEYCFYASDKLEIIDLSETHVEDINKRTFSVCQMLKEVKFPSSLHSIGYQAFNECSKLEKNNLEDTSIKSIANEAFSGCKKLQYIKLPSTFETIGEKAFYNCESLASIDLSSTQLETIPDYCFTNCINCTEIKLPTSLKHIGEQAFRNNRSVSNIDFESLNIETFGDSAFSVCESLTNIKLSNTCKFLNSGVFNSCRNIVNVDLSLTQIESIETNTFAGCQKLKTIKLPSTVKNFKKESFSYQTQLESIEFDGTEAEFRNINIDSEAFTGTPNTVEIKFNNGTSIHLSNL